MNSYLLHFITNIIELNQTE